MQPESKKLVKEDGGGGFFPNKKNKKKTTKKKKCCRKVGVTSGQCLSHTTRSPRTVSKRIDLQSCWLQYMHSFTQK